MIKIGVREKRVLDYIERSISENGYAPSVRDIQDALGFKSTSTVQTAIINFFIIALTLFVILKVAMKSRQMIDSFSSKVKKGRATEEEKKALAERGVSTKDRKAYKEALIAYRKELADKKKEQEANKPLIETDIDVLKDIRELLKAQAEEKTTKSKK